LEVREWKRGVKAEEMMEKTSEEIACAVVSAAF